MIKSRKFIFISLMLVALTILIGVFIHNQAQNKNKVNTTKSITYKDLTNNKYVGQNYYLKNVYVNQRFTKNNIKQVTVSDNRNRLYFVILNHNNLPNGTTSLLCKIEKHKTLKTNLGYKYRYPVLKLINKKTAD
ncbi:hypothetical protein DY138_02550 [Apilactobacillus timberlakei]|uniref:hypothetical protein n=1 Tax=Apilactobacillus timberlakei TaxID=2008380 RepID=UPI001126214D|nr:hypothetical protein [Apilactobacillus timberlakei]TPR19541.1 hypothetical protein DY138_02550 [Apilactobacillus timberlakei]TPR20518.1 hypothetical protein DY061_04190 [Apilactobacillus timberlakei]TPR22562.1 hypothetical protein DY083_03460 [Apilactobacillus timberlakei]